MRVAVLSDIHGFSIALETVLADLARHEPLDQIVVAGDLCEVGPDPAGVLDILQGHADDPRWTVLTGNTDHDIVEAASHGAHDGGVAYVLEHIGDEGVRYLAGLPFSHRITPPGGDSPADDLLVVHANPHDLYQRLDPALSDAELRAVIGPTQARAIAFGHIHICYVREIDDILLVDVSAVGNPKDGDLRCAYGILDWDADARRWTGTIHRIDYPTADTEVQVLASGLPRPEKTIKKLLRATY